MQLASKKPTMSLSGGGPAFGISGISNPSDEEIKKIRKLVSVSLRFIAKEAELNYFAFEAHMRKSLRELIEPYVNKATQDRELIAEAKRQMNTINKRVKDLE